VNALQKKFALYRKRALAVFGEVCQIEGEEYACIPSDTTSESSREEGGFFNGLGGSLVIFKVDFADGKSLVNRTVTFRDQEYRVESVGDQVQVGAWELRLVEDGK
jgi:hypothetical protein